MLGHRLRTFTLVVSVSAALLLGTAAAAFGAPSLFPLTARPVGASPAAVTAKMHALGSGPFTAAGTSVRELPPGNTITGRMSPDGAVWLFFAHRGQRIRLSLSAAPSAGFIMALFDQGMLSSGASAEEAIVDAAQAGTPIDYRAPYDAIYALAVFPEATGGYRLTWDIGDPYILTTRTYRVSGANRYDTALQLSSSWTTASAAIVCTGKGFADALAASALAGSYDCPVLLTDPFTLSPGIDARITALGADKVFVIGSNKAVTDNVFNQLDHGGRDVERIQGIDRIHTAAAIADEVAAHEVAAGRAAPTQAFVINARKFPDAVAISPYAFTQRMPVLLVEQSVAPAATTAELEKLGIAKAFVIGGTGTVSDTAAAQLGVTTWERIYGADRVSTSLAAATAAVDNGWAQEGHYSLATGWDFPDALTGGPWTGKTGGVLLLSPPMDMRVDVYNRILANYLGDVTVLGSVRTVGGCVRGFADHALQGTPLPLPYHGQ